MVSTAAGAFATPDGLMAQPLSWLPARVPGTAAQCLTDAGLCSFEKPLPLDEQDHWWHCRFAAPTVAAGQKLWLQLDGLATLAEVWLNGVRLLESSNMFHAHRLDLSQGLQADNSLHIRCAALAPALALKRPRPRWRTKLVSQQALRWLRSSLFGRIPGWTPPLPAVGPWRPVSLVLEEGFSILEQDLQSRLEGSSGVVRLKLVVQALASAPDQARLRLGDTVAVLNCTALGDDRWQLEGRVELPDAPLWWPHTHGAQPLYELSVRIDGWQQSLGRTGFRQLALDTSEEGFALRVNGCKVFCRGACWTTANFLTLTSDEASTRAALLQARDAGMNLLRLSGTGFYEAPHFYALCDELGILVWQDWMFANMDYPADDPAFVASVAREASEFLGRTQICPSLAVLCGNSEVEQQVAMLGLARSLWSNSLFQTLLPALGQKLRPDVAYWPSSPAGGVLPFQVDAGVAHYFGVGAYLQPLTDARRSGVRFTSECLAFANVPEDETIEGFLADGESPFHHPKWKARVPRDSGPGWDFDDVRDHYLAEQFRVDPMRLRYADMARYLALSRVVTGEVMQATFAEWRRKGSSCNGGIVWFYRDLWPGAGWGVVDAFGRPKAAWYYLKRAFAPVTLQLTDEGVNGLALHAINDGAAPLMGSLRLCLYRQGEQLVAEGHAPLLTPARSVASLRGDALFGHFTDSTYCYRFGPAGHDLAVAQWLAEDRTLLGEAFHFPQGLPNSQHGDLGLAATLAADGWLTLSTRRFAQSVAIEARGYTLSNNYFHLAPNCQCLVRLTPIAGARQQPVTVSALNGFGRIAARPAA